MSTRRKRPSRTPEQARRVRVERDTASRLMALGYLLTSLETLRWVREKQPDRDCRKLAAKRYDKAAVILGKLQQTLQREYGHLSGSTRAAGVLL